MRSIQFFDKLSVTWYTITFVGSYLTVVLHFPFSIILIFTWVIFTGENLAKQNHNIYGSLRHKRQCFVNPDSRRALKKLSSCWLTFSQNERSCCLARLWTTVCLLCSEWMTSLLNIPSAYSPFSIAQAFFLLKTLFETITFVTCRFANSKTRTKGSEISRLLLHTASHGACLPPSTYVVHTCNINRVFD